MSNQPKKQSFLGGAAILASAVAVVKIIGAFYKLPLNNILGDVGKTYFNTAYEIYSVLLTLSTAGLPLAISKLTSQAQAQGRENEKRKILRVSLVLFFIIGAVGSLFMFTCAQQLAEFQNNQSAFLPIRVLSPAVFCVCLLACIRGYTQGPPAPRCWRLFASWDWACPLPGICCALEAAWKWALPAPSSVLRQAR